MNESAFKTLIDAGTLSANLGRDDWLICDVRHQLADTGAGERAYGAGHLPGAVFLHLDRDLSGPKNGRNGRHPLPDAARLADLFGRIGIGSDTQVVVYDDAGGMIAGRLWWLLRWLGHDRVALLDGGFATWQAAGLPIVSEAAPLRSREFKANERPEMLVGADQVEANLANRECLVVDARSPDRFRGENETLDPIGGHIPGAANRFFRDNVDGQGTMKGSDELRREYLALLGPYAPAAIVHQCGSGVSACLNVLAMEHAGLPGSRLYAGSWSEWCADPRRPVAVGAA